MSSLTLGGEERTATPQSIVSNWVDEVHQYPWNKIAVDLEFPYEIVKQFHKVLQPELFSAWLDEQDEGKAIGIRGESAKCPLAHYLFKQFPHIAFAVGDLSIYANMVVHRESYSIRISTPFWAGKFICRVDSQHMDVPFIYPEEAKKVLHRRVGEF